MYIINILTDRFTLLDHLLCKVKKKIILLHLHPILCDILKELCAIRDNTFSCDIANNNAGAPNRGGVGGVSTPPEIWMGG